MMIIIVVIVLGTVGGYYLSRCQDGICPSVENFLNGFGGWAPIIFAILYISASPIPFLATFLSAAAGLVFGPLWGTLLAIGSATVSALVPFTLARRLGQEWVESKLKGKKLENIYQKAEGQGAFLFILMMRLIPIIPWEIQNYIAGLTKTPYTTFFFATALGIIPGTFSLVFLGSAASDPGSWQFWLAIGLTVTMMGLPILFSLLRKKKQSEKFGDQLE
ncbi:MAG: TVP38/TMEM64 family protein [Anaerolineae bacterium]|nr:TVP38/TMEM64 family protein [Anaerolineae bacterium]